MNEIILESEEVIAARMKEATNALKEAQERVREIKCEMKALDEYKKIKWNKYRTRSDKLFGHYLYSEELAGILRKLSIYVVGIAVRDIGSSRRWDLYPRYSKLNQLTSRKLKLCNDFINDMYEVIEKYAHNVLVDLGYTEANKND